jgi:hypothetical protein
MAFGGLSYMIFHFSDTHGAFLGDCSGLQSFSLVYMPSPSAKQRAFSFCLLSRFLFSRLQLMRAVIPEACLLLCISLGRFSQVLVAFSL